MNDGNHSKDKYEGDNQLEARLKNVEETFIFDSDSGIYKPKRHQSEKEREAKQRGASWRSAFFVRTSSDGCLIAIGTFSAFVAFVTMFVVGIYTYYAKQQVEQMRIATKASQTSAIAAQRTVKNSEDFFLIEQRPYIVVQQNYPMFVDIPPTPKTPVRVNVQLQNIGKTSAIQVVTKVHFFPYRSKLLKNMTTAEGREERQKYISMLESKFTEMRIADEKEREKLKALAAISPGTDVPPNQIILTTPKEEYPMQPADTGLLISQELMFLVVGRASFTDSHGKIYVSEYCYQFFGPYPQIWHICDSHNRFQ
jgi:hypothetical protein